MRSPIRQLMHVILAFLLVSNPLLGAFYPLLPAPLAPAPVSAALLSSLQPTNEETTTTVPSGVDIEITDSAFEPDVLTVVAGTTVTWMNNGSVSHQVKSGTPPSPKGHIVYLPLLSAGTTLRQSSTAAPQRASEMDTLGGDWESGVLNPGQTFNYTFSSAGTYDYYDALHPELSAQVIVLANGELTLVPIGEQSAPLGSTLTLELEATYDGQEPLEFGISPIPLFSNATFDATSGRFTFTPSEEQIGSFALTFSVTAGTASDSQSITITVPEPNPNDETALQGRILDANDATQATMTPLEGATVTHIESGISTTTDSDGYFTLSALPAGASHFEYDARTVAPAGTYGAYRSEKVLIANVTNMIERPIYIMAIDTAGEVEVDPDSETVVNNPNIDTTVMIPPHTVMDEDGNEFDGMISISPVPAGFTPGSLPDTLVPDQVITVQPMGLTFNTPAPVTFPNTSGLSPGSEVDIWSMDHSTSEFFVAGTGQVTDDGTMIETIDGGIREASWHFPLPSGPNPEDSNDQNGENDDGTDCETASTFTLHNGCLGTTVSLPSYLSLGESRAVEFVYQSDRANPQPLIPFQATVQSQTPVPLLMSYELSVGGLLQGNTGFIDSSSLDDELDSSIRASMSIGGSTLTTGIYPYTVRLTSHYEGSDVSSNIQGQVLISNEQDSPFGAGWTLAEITRLWIQDDGNILLTQGDGGALQFTPTSSIFPTDPETLLLLEFNNNLWDLSGNRRDATLIGGEYVETSHGLGLHIGPEDPTGISLSQFASLLVHPYTIEIILTPEETSGWRKIFSFDDSSDRGWYYRSQGLQAYPNSVIGADQVQAGEQHYIAFVSSAPDQIDIYFQGSFLGSTNASFTAPPPEAIFFRDDTATGRGEQLDAVIEALRISAVTRTGEEIAAIEQNLQMDTVPINNEEGYQSPVGDFSTLIENENGTFTRRMKDGTEYHFNADGYQTAMVDRNGNTTTYAYSGERLTSITDPVGLVTTLTYSGDHLSSVSDPTGRETLFEHDANGNLVGVTYPDGEEQSFGYDSRHLMISESDRRGFITMREYDQWGRLTNATMPDDSVRQATYSQSVGLIDPDSDLGSEDNPAPVVRPEEAVSTLTDGEGRTTTYNIGPLGRFSGITNPAGFTSIIERNEDGNPTQTTTPSGAIFDNSYDERGNQLAFTDQTLNGTTSYTYEETFNQVTSITDPFAEVTKIGYDEQGNPISITTPLLRTFTFDYNSQGLLTNLTDPLATESAFSYDSQGNLTQVVQGAGAAQRSATLNYTDEGYVEAITDPEEREFDFAYDALGRLTSETLPANRTISYNYDDDGNLTSLTPPSRPAHTFEYDELGLMTAYIPPAVARSGSTQTTYQYNNAQELTQITRPDGQALTYSYDDAGRLTTVTIPRGTYSYAYDNVTGQLDMMTAPDGSTLQYDYNGELLTQVAWSGEINGDVAYRYDRAARLDRITINGENYDIGYDADNMLTQAGGLTLNYAGDSGLITGSTLGNVSDSWSFNQFVELDSYSAAYNGGNLFEATYTRDHLGRITQKVETVNDTTTIYAYAYDAASRLSEIRKDGVVQATYTYDANGNRLNDGTNTGTYDDQDRLLTYGANSYTYTANGELLTKTRNGQTTQYNYDVLGNLLSVTLPDGTSIEYVIDAADRRIGKKVNGTLLQGLLYGDDLNPVVELDGSGNVVSHFIYASQSNVPDYMVKGSTTYRIIPDHLGSVRLVVDTSTGAVVQRVNYDGWGVVTEDTNPGFQPFGFAGGLYDADTGQVRFGARDYDASIGRWTTKDPIKFQARELNLFSYSFNNPLGWIDPSGLDVLLCSRPADLPGPLKYGNHFWLKTSKHEAGMGPTTGEIPAQNGNSGTPGDPTETTNHSGQSESDNASCVPIPDADEQCVNKKIKPGQSTGNWFPGKNDCFSFAKDIIHQCGGSVPKTTLFDSFNTPFQIRIKYIGK